MKWAKRSPRSFDSLNLFLVQDVIVSNPLGPEEKRVFLLTEPPAAAFADREAWIKETFKRNFLVYGVAEHPLGFDGFSRDVYVVTSAISEAQIANFVDGVHQVFFKTDYKAAYRIFEPKSWNKVRKAIRKIGPENLEVSANSLYNWLFGTQAINFSSDPFDTLSPTVKQAGAKNLPKKKSGVYYSEPAGLVLIVVSRDKTLNDLQPQMRRFFVDTDTLLGAVSYDGELLLVGRERTAALNQMPPLRIDTVLTLAASGTRDLAQSYQRTMPFAGEITDPELIETMHERQLVDTFKDSFGYDGSVDTAPPDSFLSLGFEELALTAMVDWAPILLSRELTHTEYGQLLNITDQMLKSWSKANRVDYVNFDYPKPFGNPDAVGIRQRLQKQITTPFRTLTYNWNTSGFGTWTEIDGVKIFTLAKTGSLPVSYFPDDGSFVIEGTAETTIQAAEDDYWTFFASLRDPNLARAAQYAALHIIFQTHPLNAKRTEPLVEKVEYDARWTGLEKQVAEALQLIRLHALEGTHPLDEMVPISNYGYGTLVDIERNCGLNNSDKLDWHEDAATTSAKTFVVGLDQWDEAAKLLIDPVDAYTEIQEQIRTYETRAKPFEQRVDDYNRQVNQCNRGESCQTSSLNAALRFLESERHLLDQKREQIRTMQDQFYRALDSLKGISAHFSSFGNCTEAWNKVVENVPPVGASVYKTPSIVLSNNPWHLGSVGGHNLDGRSVRVLKDDSVDIGRVEIDAQSGIIRVNPGDIGKAQTVARTFERNYKRFLSGDETFKARVIARVESSLSQDTRALRAFDTLALARSGEPMPGARGAVLRSASARQSPDHHVGTRQMAIELEPGLAAELSASIGSSGSVQQGLVRLVDNGLIEVSLPGGRPPVAIRVASREDVGKAIEDLGGYAARGAQDSVETIRFIDRDGLLSLGDLNAIKYSAIGRQTASSGGGGRIPPINGNRPTASLPDGPSSGSNGFFARGGNGGEPLRLAAFWTKKGNASSKLARTDADWSNAVVKTVAIRQLGADSGTLSTSIQLNFRSAEVTQPSMLARIKAFFTQRKPNQQDADSLTKAIGDLSLEDANTPLWQQLEAIRLNFEASVSGETPRLLWRLQDTLDDFYVVEDDSAQEVTVYFRG